MGAIAILRIFYLHPEMCDDTYKALTDSNCVHVYLSLSSTFHGDNAESWFDTEFSLCRLLEPIWCSIFSLFWNPQKKISHIRRINLCRILHLEAHQKDVHHSNSMQSMSELDEHRFNPSIIIIITHLLTQCIRSPKSSDFTITTRILSLQQRKTLLHAAISHLQTISS